MRTKVHCIALLLPLVLVLAGGCVTHVLWEDDAWKEPSSPLNLRLFASVPQTNLLVVYSECSDRNDAIHTRAYWLNENKGVVAHHRRPHFIAARTSRKLPRVPVFYEPLAIGTQLPPELCAVVATNKQSFTVYLAGHAVASHGLPVYNDAMERASKIALTPLTVVVDISIVGGAIAYCVYDGWHEDYRNHPPAIGSGPYD